MNTQISTEELYEIFRQHPVITTDSRDCPKGSLFIALKGENFDGNRFAAETIEKGCAYAVVDDERYATDPRIRLTDNGLACLQRLALHHRRQLRDIPVIGITGTNGKTTTKELCAAVLSRKYRVLYTQGNLNNHIGVPRTLLQLSRRHDIAIVEMGANHPGEIQTLVNIALPDYGLITNVGMAHLAGFGSFEGVKRTKGELYDFLRLNGGKAFVNLSNSHLTGMAQSLDVIGYSTEAGCGVSPRRDGAQVWGQVVESAPFLKVAWEDEEGCHLAQTKLVGAYNLENALAAVSVGRRFGVPVDDIVRALEEYTPSNNRSQWQKSARNTLVIDAYNANPSSMNAALDNFLAQDALSKTVVLGGMRELGAYSLEEHRRIVRRLEQDGVEAFLIGSEFADVFNGETPSRIHLLADAEAARTYLSEHPLLHRTILVKGSRSNRLETLLDLL